MFHEAELIFGPEGVKKGYPTVIDFDRLPERIKKLEPKLLAIIEGKVRSQYRELSMDAYNEFGQKARTPMVLMGRFEELQVSKIYKLQRKC